MTRRNQDGTERDTKREEVYAWEKRLPGRVLSDTSLATHPNRMTEDQCRTLVHAAMRRHGLGHLTSGLTFLFRNSQNAAVYRPNAFYISLPPWARQPIVVLHEAAHLITHERKRTREIVRDRLVEHFPKWHGPEFLQVFTDLILWAKLPGIDKEYLRKTLKEAKLRRARGAKKVIAVNTGKRFRCPWAPRTILPRVRLTAEARSRIMAEETEDPGVVQSRAASPGPSQSVQEAPPPVPPPSVGCPICDEELVEGACTNPNCGKEKK